MIRLALRVRREHAELVLAELLELAPEGVEEIDGGDTVEYALYGTPGELPRLPQLTAVAGNSLVEISTSEVADDWAQRWRRFHRPVLIEPPPVHEGDPGGVPALRVRPAWEPPAEGGEEVQEIVIEPAQAFGTGAHASTRLCLQLLLALASELPRRRALLDVGTGSGVLAIAAARLGFAPVMAVDNEQESVAAARDNARANGVRIQVRRLDLRHEQLPWLGREATQAGGGGAGSGAPPAQAVVTANLLRTLLLELATALAAAPSHLIAGGLLTEESDEIARAFAERAGLHERARLEQAGWAALWLARD